MSLLQGCMAWCTFLFLKPQYMKMHIWNGGLYQVMYFRSQQMTSESIAPWKGWCGSRYLFVCVLQTNCIILPVTVQTVWVDHSRDWGYLEGFLEQDSQDNHQGQGWVGQASMKIWGKAYAITRNTCLPLQVFCWVWRGQGDRDNRCCIKVRA